MSKGPTVIAEDLDNGITRVTHRSEAGHKSIDDFVTGSSTIRRQSQEFKGEHELLSTSFYDPEGEKTGSEYYQSPSETVIRDADGNDMGIHHKDASGAVVKVDEVNVRGQRSELAAGFFANRDDASKPAVMKVNAPAFKHS